MPSLKNVAFFVLYYGQCCGSGAFLTPGSRIRDGLKIKIIPYHISESLETIFGLEILKFFYANPDPGSGMFLTLARDP
jgi:hypothetical protein